MVRGWRIYYEDETTWDSRRGSWVGAPDDGVTHVIVFFEDRDGEGRPTRLVMAGNNSYFSDGAQLFGCNQSTKEHNRGRYPKAEVKLGKWVSHDLWDVIDRTARADYHIP